MLQKKIMAKGYIPILSPTSTARAHSPMYHPLLVVEHTHQNGTSSLAHKQESYIFLCMSRH